MIKILIDFKFKVIICNLLIFTFCTGSYLTANSQFKHGEPIDIRSRLELFVDDYLIETISGDAELRLHHPVPQEVVMVHDAPWEGSNSGNHSIFQDGDIYRMYYTAAQTTVTPYEVKLPDRAFCCYAESEDGIHWTRPVLGLHEFQGSMANNIVMAPSKMKGTNKIVEISWKSVSSIAVFKDENPNAPLDARYKAIVRLDGLIPFKSPDGIHWSPMCDTAVITHGAFDSQNLAFWDGVRGEYRAYWRYFTEGSTPMPQTPETWKPAGHRAIRTATSIDLLNWHEEADLCYVDSPSEQLYTNVIKPYYRAPHIFIGFPTRYIDRGWSESMRKLPEREHREWRAKGKKRYGTALTEALFMSSRDGVLFKRWNEAFLRPGIEREGTWNYGNQYIAWSVVETKSTIKGAPNELSFYANEHAWTGASNALRRYTLRLDGFVSVNAPMSGGELVTKPITFNGSQLVLNFSSSAAGGIQVEIQDENGDPILGYTLDNCHPIFGDTIERIVTWKNGSDVSLLEGKPVRIRFYMKDSDIYSFRFR
jgi:hypothetical protein